MCADCNHQLFSHVHEKCIFDADFLHGPIVAVLLVYCMILNSAKYDVHIRLAYTFIYQKKSETARKKTPNVECMCVS